MQLIVYGDVIECTHISKGTDYLRVYQGAQLIREYAGIQDFTGYKLRGDDGTPVPLDDPAELRAAKLAEVDAACEAAIHAGVDVETSIGTKHFNLSANDQINLLGYKGELATALAGLPSGVDPKQGVWYKADGPGETHRYWSVEDFGAIATKAFAHKVSQLTYCDALKAYVAGLESEEEIAAVGYGMEVEG